jgi:dTDP-3-amino-3,4,6-trideoxy-alpha-D-glucose transaminase
MYVARSERADELAAALNERGVGARGYYRTPVHRQPAMRGFAAPELPGTEEAARSHLALPMGTLLSDEAVREVVEACASGST